MRRRQRYDAAKKAFFEDLERLDSLSEDEEDRMTLRSHSKIKKVLRDEGSAVMKLRSTVTKTEVRVIAPSTLEACPEREKRPRCVVTAARSDETLTEVTVQSTSRTAGEMPRNKKAVPVSGKGKRQCSSRTVLEEQQIFKGLVFCRSSFTFGSSSWILELTPFVSQSSFRTTVPQPFDACVSSARRITVLLLQKTGATKSLMS